MKYTRTIAPVVALVLGVSSWAGTAAAQDAVGGQDGVAARARRRGAPRGQAAEATVQARRGAVPANFCAAEGRTVEQGRCLDQVDQGSAAHGACPVSAPDAPHPLPFLLRRVVDLDERVRGPSRRPAYLSARQAAATRGLEVAATSGPGRAGIRGQVRSGAAGMAAAG